MFNLLLLKSFVAIIDERSFTRAARRLSLTQPAISGHLRRLEQETGKLLLRRTTRSFEVTPAGECLASYARAILSLNRDAMAQLRPSAHHAECIRIGVSEDFPHARLLGVVKEFRRKRAMTEIEVQVGIPGDLILSMREGQVDLVIGAQCGMEESGELLWREPLVWAWSKEAEGPLPRPLPMAFFPEPCPYREAAQTQLALSGISQRTVMLCMSGASLRAAAESGFAIAPMPIGQLTPGLVALSAEHGLPPLPDARFVVLTGGEAKERSSVSDLAGCIVEALGRKVGVATPTDDRVPIAEQVEKAPAASAL